MDDLVPIVAIVSVFGTPVAIVWIVMHYRARRRELEHLGSDDQAAIETMTRVAERLEERVATLEKILDVEQPRWRQSSKEAGR